MEYMICPTCGELNGNKTEPFTKGKKEICKKYKVSADDTSIGIHEENADFAKDMSKLVDGLVNKDSLCCAARMQNLIDLVELIK